MSFFQFVLNEFSFDRSSNRKWLFLVATFAWHRRQLIWNSSGKCGRKAACGVDVCKCTGNNAHWNLICNLKNRKTNIKFKICSRDHCQLTENKAQRNLNGKTKTVKEKHNWLYIECILDTRFECKKKTENSKRTASSFPSKRAHAHRRGPETKGNTTLTVCFAASSWESYGRNAKLHFKCNRNRGKWNDSYKWNEEWIKCRTMYAAWTATEWVARWVATLTKRDDDVDDPIYGKQVNYFAERVSLSHHVFMLLFLWLMVWSGAMRCTYSLAWISAQILFIPNSCIYLELTYVCQLQPVCF